MTVEVALAPRDEAGLNAELQAVYTKGNPRYGKFLRAGQFDALYAPTTASRNSVEDYLRSAGLAVSAGDSPFVIEATGASAKITAAFHTDFTFDRQMLDLVSGISGDDDTRRIVAKLRGITFSGRPLVRSAKPFAQRTSP